MKVVETRQKKKGWWEHPKCRDLGRGTGVEIHGSDAV